MRRPTTSDAVFVTAASCGGQMNYRALIVEERRVRHHDDKSLLRQILEKGEDLLSRLCIDTVLYLVNKIDLPVPDEITQ